LILVQRTIEQGRQAAKEQRMEAYEEKVLPPFPSQAGGISNLARSGRHSWVGQIDILGVRHHAAFTEVVLENNVQVPVDDSDGVFAAAEAIYEGDSPYQTVSLPGIPGEFILVIHPAC
jgi:hypothetical protein